MHTFSTAVFFVLCLMLTPAYSQTASAVPPLLKQNKCGECHRFSVDTHQSSKKAPDLFYAGNKFQKNWLNEYLQNPMPIRMAGYMTDPGFLLGKPTVAQHHPTLAKEQAGVMTDYLMSLKVSGLAAGVPDGEVLSKGKKAKAKILFERNYGCTSCHQAINLAKKVRGGISGPSLVDAGNRLQADWIFNWLQDPKKFEPKGRMPLFDFSQREEELVLITKYILTLKKENLQ